MLAVTSYEIVKFFHVALAIAWVGGGLMLTILAEFAIRSKIPGRAAEFAREAGFVGERIFTPIALLVLGIGFYLVHDQGWGYHFWVIASLVIYGLSFALGVGFLSPQAKKLAKLIEAEGPDTPNVRGQIRLIVSIARIDVVFLFTIVFLMVTKIGQ
jgi:uncharacterized membrane protein